MKFRCERQIRSTSIFIVESTNGTANAQVTTRDRSSSPFSLCNFFFLQWFYHVSRRADSVFHFAIHIFHTHSLECSKKNMTHLCNNNWMGVDTRECEWVSQKPEPKSNQWSKQVNKWCEHKKPRCVRWWRKKKCNHRSNKVPSVPCFIRLRWNVGST